MPLPKALSSLMARLPSLNHQGVKDDATVGAVSQTTTATSLARTLLERNTHLLIPRRVPPLAIPTIIEPLCISNVNVPENLLHSGGDRVALLNAMLIGLDWYCNARTLLFAHYGARALIHAPDRFGHSHSSLAAVLEALDLPYNVKLWTFASDAHGVKDPEFLAINPNGRVPALQDPNTNITSWESMACINYLLRNYDTDNKLGASSEAGRVEIDQWTSFLISTMGPMIGQCNWFRHYNAVKNEDAYKRYEAQAYRCFGVLENRLKSHEGGWVIAGKECSVVDLHFEPRIRQYGYAGLSLDEYPKVKTWLEWGQELPEVVKAYEMVKAGEEV
ncbi:glutathione S-transferase [Aureobasidium pullulans]|uniref:Glutathione S-transferase n=1 Tax=Aureobasidium pullulans TaxID=5580 RepID=A0A4S9LAJ8_AURPU|nr:glutathione S-transferase [Aureobasidium pullulans]